MVISAQEPDLGTVATLAAQLWPDNTPSELVSEFQQLLSQGQTQFFLKILDDQDIGFAQCQLRHDYVEGTSTSPVGYLEGLFIYDQYRHQGYATELLNACKAWAKSQGCTEFASDPVTARSLTKPVLASTSTQALRKPTVSFALPARSKQRLFAPQPQ